MSATWHADRLGRAREALARCDADALLLGPGADLRYLTGYDAPLLERLTMLVLPTEGEPALVVPELELPRAADQLGGLALEVAGWAETRDPVALVTAVLERAGAAKGRLAVGDRLWGSFLLKLQASLPAAQWLPASGVTRTLRIVKDAAEIDALLAVAAAIDRVVEDLDGLRWSGRTEREVARDIDDAIRSGHDQTHFVIVASGPNGASPHHAPGARRISPGDAVVVDIGGSLDGYCSDTTRTLVVGEPPEGFEAMYDVLRRAQHAGCDAVRPGVAAEAVDAACRDPIAAAGYGEHFVHRTGHGIGLEEHEEPWIVAGNSEPLAAGMAFSIEPGIYLPDRYGARIEDIVVCTGDGVRMLNTTARELRVVPG